MDEGLETGKIDGFEKNLLVYQLNAMAGRAPYVTANVNLWLQMDALFGNPGRLAALTEQQRGWPSSRPQRPLVSRPRRPRHPDPGNHLRVGARLANASNRDLAALREAFAPVHAKLQDNPRPSSSLSRSWR